MKLQDLSWGSHAMIVAMVGSEIWTVCGKLGALRFGLRRTGVNMIEEVVGIYGEGFEFLL